MFLPFFVDQSMMTEWVALISVPVMGHPGDVCTMYIRDWEGVPQEASALVPRAGLWMKMEMSTWTVVRVEHSSGDCEYKISVCIM